MRIIDDKLLEEVSAKAKDSPRLRMNFNFHGSLEDKDDGEVLESVVLCQEDGMYGVDIPKNVWHTLESLDPGSVIFECKEGPFVEHEEEGVLTLKG